MDYRDVVEENAERFPFVFDRIPIIHAAAPLSSVKSTFQRYRTGNNADFFGTPLFELEYGAWVVDVDCGRV